MPTGASSAADEELEDELRRYYLSTAGERLQRLDAAIAVARRSPEDAGAVASLRELIHKVAGSAGTYGFTELSASARAMEHRLVAAAQSLPVSDELFRDLQMFRAAVEGSVRVPEAPQKAAIHAAPPPAEPVMSEARRRLVVAVIGDTGADAGAAAVGRELARAGTHLLIARGSGTPVEAARAFREQGGAGLVFGLLPGNDRAVAPVWVDVPLPTGLGPAQASLVSLWADAAVAIGGGATTLAELSLFLHHGKPVVALQGSGGAAGVAASAWLDGRAPLLASDAADAVLSVLHALSSTPATR